MTDRYLKPGNFVALVAAGAPVRGHYESCAPCTKGGPSHRCPVGAELFQDYVDKVCAKERA